MCIVVFVFVWVPSFDWCLKQPFVSRINPLFHGSPRQHNRLIVLLILPPTPAGSSNRIVSKLPLIRLCTRDFQQVDPSPVVDSHCNPA